MKKLEAYLFFDGNCREALDFYRGVFGGEVFAMRAGEAPDSAGMPPEAAGRILHGRLSGEGFALMASDWMAQEPAERPGGFSLSIEASDRREQERLFAGLSEGGTVSMPLQDTFWGAHFGMVSDRFGVRWMLSSDPRS